MLKIGVMGLLFNSGNKGCSALGYSFMQILEDIAVKKDMQITVYVFTPANILRYFLKPTYKKMLLPKVSFKNIQCKLRPLNSGRFSFITNKAFKECEMIFDFTAGDSFADIYGLERFNTDAVYKERIIESGVPLILGSQTYGPFKNSEAEQRAAEIIKNAYRVFARDEISGKYVQKLTGRDAIQTTDIAFTMKFKKMPETKCEKIKIGLNPSGLLWSGGYTKDNQFGLRFDYKQYCESLVEELLAQGKYEIHLIPHVFTSNPKIIDNDLIACCALKEKYPELVQAPLYELPMDIKSYIAQMDVFTGARMHATIGAISAGVATIPFSYSRKFEGLYSYLGYDYVISACEWDAEKALDVTLQYIAQYESLQYAVGRIMPTIMELNKMAIYYTESVIEEITTHE